MHITVCRYYFTSLFRRAAFLLLKGKVLWKGTNYISDTVLKCCNMLALVFPRQLTVCD